LSSTESDPPDSDKEPVEVPLKGQELIAFLEAMKSGDIVVLEDDGDPD
jgi:hypothetical protein